MDNSHSRSRRILQLVAQKGSQNPVPEKMEERCRSLVFTETKSNHLQTSSKDFASFNKENLSSDDSGDFSPVSDDDRTYAPPKKRCRKSSSSSTSRSSSSSSSCSCSTRSSTCSSSASSHSLTKSVAYVDEKNAELSNENEIIIHEEVVSKNGGDLTTIINENNSNYFNEDFNEHVISNDVGEELLTITDNENVRIANNNVVEDIPSAVGNGIDKPRKQKKNERYAKTVKLNKSVDGQVVKLSNLKVIKVEKNEHEDIKISYKTSYFDDFKELDLNKRSNRNSRPSEIKPLYQRKLDISQRKKDDVNVNQIRNLGCGTSNLEAEEMSNQNVKGHNSTSSVQVSEKADLDSKEVIKQITQPTRNLETRVV
ncbi:unnamed protein product [Diabrotica balteata]|uniref:Uncharacterized protein n=1 Tax=Diabrotica balteata TaxID=107213 RepID=A0A9N9TBF0_DIABA|nr:unnamed protein product [Diabrotica balteata]